MLRVLILGGTTEASALARMLTNEPRIAATLSLAGRTRAPVLPPIPVRIGGFGGIDGLVAYLQAEKIDALIDATHPFAAQMTRHAAEAAASSGVPMLRIARPAWRMQPGDRWAAVADMAAAARALGPDRRRVLLTVGQQELAPFAAAPWHQYVVRSVDPIPPGLLPPDAMTITARGPFTEDDERVLLQTHRIEVLVTKNSGGGATGAKLAAARALGIAVVMVERPVEPPLQSVPDAAAALRWLQHQAVSRRGV